RNRDRLRYGLGPSVLRERGRPPPPSRSARSNLRSGPSERIVPDRGHHDVVVGRNITPDSHEGPPPAISPARAPAPLQHPFTTATRPHASIQNISGVAQGPAVRSVIP